MSYKEITINGQQIKLIPLGDCACGCGGKTRVSLVNSKSRGLVNGQPLKYIHGHNRNHYPKNFHPPKGPKSHAWKGGVIRHGAGYVLIYNPGHHRSDPRGYVFEHILICEKALGKPILRPAEPHHVNGIKDDNRNANLVLCQDSAYHQLLHQRKDAFYACGHAKWRKCSYCKKYDEPNKLQIKFGQCFHSDCRNKYRRDRRKTKLNQAASSDGNDSMED